MDFIFNYFVCNDERALSDEALSWLTIAHLPHRIDRENGRLFVFNIAKYYLHFFVEQFRLENWYFRTEIPKFGDLLVKSILVTADRKIAENIDVYHAYTRDPNEAPFVLPSVYDEIARKAFGGTGYNNWKTRFYLTRGLLSEEFADVLVKDAIETYNHHLSEAANEVEANIDTLKQHIYFDSKTFYYGLFQNSDEYLTYVGGIRKLNALNVKMKERLRQLGLERNIHSRCGIDKYLDIFNIEMPRHFMDYDLPEGRDIRNFAIVPIHPKKDFLKWIDAKVYGIDNQTKSHVLINQEHNLHRLIDEFDKMCYSSIIPDEEDDEYYQFFRNIQAQIDYNKSLPYWQGLPFCQLKHDKKYDHLKGLDANAEDHREPVTDEPHRVIQLRHAYADPFNHISPYIEDKIGDLLKNEYILSMEIRIDDGSPIIKYLIFQWRPRSGKYNSVEDDELFKWFGDKGFELYPSGALAVGNTIINFFEKLLKEIPELGEYFEII